jgi:hypothetical protein
MKLPLGRCGFREGKLVLSLDEERRMVVLRQSFAEMLDEEDVPVFVKTSEYAEKGEPS